MKFPDGRAMGARFIGLTRNPWLPNFPAETLNTVTLAEEKGKTLLAITVVPFHASHEEASVFAGGIAGMERGFGASFKLPEDYLARRN
jgi:hypothetical protein